MTNTQSPAPGVAAIETAAKLIYETWLELDGYKPWQDGGNSLKQDEARRIATKVGAALQASAAAVEPDGWQVQIQFSDGPKWSSCSKEEYEMHRDMGNTVRLLYTAPPIPAQACQHRFMHFGDQTARRCADCNEPEAAQVQAADELQSLREADEMLKEIGSMCRDQTMFVGSYAEIVRQALASRTPAPGKGKCYCDHHEHCSVCTPSLWVRKSEVSAPGMAGGVGAITLSKDEDGIVWLHFNAGQGQQAMLNLNNVIAERRGTFTTRAMEDAINAYPVVAPHSSPASQVVGAEEPPPDEAYQRKNAELWNLGRSVGK